MALTTAQQATLKAYILGDPVLSAFPMSSDGAYEIALALNAEASPAFYVWDNAYAPDKIRSAINNGITQLDALTASKRDSLLWWAQGTHNMNLAAARTAADDLTGSQTTLKAAILDGAKVKARLIEKVLATGTGSFASPATAGYSGTVSYQDVEQARAA